MANYEMMYIIAPDLSEDEKTSSAGNLKSILEKYSAKIEKEDIWGDKKMAYKIGRYSRGFYALLDLELDGKFIKDISKEINLQGNILRYMFVKKDA